MSERSERAVELFGNGYNCCQSVLSVFCEDLGLDMQTALKVGCGFGGGLRHGEVCGAVSGAVMAIGLKCGHYAEGDTKAKNYCYNNTAEYMRSFDEAHGTVVCRELLGYDIRDNEARVKNKDRQAVICPNLISSAVKLLEQLKFDTEE